MVEGNAAIRDIQTEGLEETTVMGLGQSKEVESHIIKVLTENYKYTKESSIREAASNALDSHIMSNKLDTPFHVRLYKNETGNYNLEIEDFGLGMNEQDFDYYYMKIGNSSKRGVAGVLGFYGCGAKAPLSFLDSYEVTTRKNGVEYKFLIFKGEERPEKTKIYEKSTEKENGVLIKLTIDRWEFSEAKTAIKQQLCYFKTAYIQIEGDNFDYLNAKIFENDLFSYSEVYPNTEAHINFGGVRYPIDWEILKISKINLPIGIKIAPDNGINPFFNRESLEYSSLCKTTILSKIKEVADWFVNRYNSEWKEYETFQKAYYEIYNNSKNVIVADVDFKIDDLLEYSDVKPLELKIKGVELNTPRFYRDNAHHFLDEYECLVDYSDYKRIWRTKHVKTNHGISKILDGVKHIEVSKIPTGKVKRYLLEKYNSKLVFIKKVNTRRLGDIKNMLSNTNILNYSYILDFHKHDKSTWRGLIQEWQFVENQLKCQITDEKDVESTKEYQDWLIKDKEQQKANRTNYGSSSTSNYKRINKQAGDITIQIAVSKEIGEGCKFVKKAVKITDLNKLHKSTHALHIYFPEEQKARAANYWELLHNKYSICIISKNEIKKLPKIKNFMKEEEFLQSRAFCKLMTSLKYETAIDNYNDIYRGTQSQIVDNVLNKFKEQRDVLSKYVNQNGKNVSDELVNHLKEIAELKGLYDHSLDDVYTEFVKNTDKYSFISCLKKPHSWETEEVAKYNKLINSLLLLKKKYNNFEELEIEVKEKPTAVVAVIEEETILEEQLETV